MELLIFTFYTFLFLLNFSIKSMEKEVTLFQPKSLQELCIKAFYSDTTQEKHKNKTNANKDNATFSSENINALNKQLACKLYPNIAYHVLKTNKITVLNKYAIICFLRDYSDIYDKKSKKILQFFAYFIDSNNYYHSQLLPVALKDTMKPCIFNYLLQCGEKPEILSVWHSIYNEYQYQITNSYLIKKLIFLRKYKKSHLN